MGIRSQPTGIQSIGSSILDGIKTGVDFARTKGALDLQREQLAAQKEELDMKRKQERAQSLGLTLQKLAGAATFTENPGFRKKQMDVILKKAQDLGIAVDPLYVDALNDPESRQVILEGINNYTNAAPEAQVAMTPQLMQSLSEFDPEFVKQLLLQNKDVQARNADLEKTKLAEQSKLAQTREQAIPELRKETTKDTKNLSDAMDTSTRIKSIAGDIIALRDAGKIKVDPKTGLVNQDGSGIQELELLKQLAKFMDSKTRALGESGEIAGARAGLETVVQSIKSIFTDERLTSKQLDQIIPMVERAEKIFQDAESEILAPKVNQIKAQGLPQEQILEPGQISRLNQREAAGAADDQIVDQIKPIVEQGKSKGETISRQRLEELIGKPLTDAQAKKLGVK